MARVLLVEDDESLGRTLAERLEKEHLTVEWAQTIAAARTHLASGTWDLAILDVKLPDGSGFGLARQIRKTSRTPIMFMTALNSAENRLEGFEIGADEYLPKPFHLREFIIRVRHVLGRQRTTRVVRAGGATIDLDAMSVELAGGAKAFLQVRDSRVLTLLIEAAPRVVNRSDILDRVWGEEQFPTPRAVDNAVVRLRQALGDDQGELIRSVRGIGYQWAGSEDN
jgi:two-component system phosphate regulon response regulator PhoB